MSTLVIANVFVKKIVYLYGLPQTITSDCVMKFVSHFGEAVGYISSCFFSPITFTQMARLRL